MAFLFNVISTTILHNNMILTTSWPKYVCQRKLSCLAEHILALKYVIALHYTVVFQATGVTPRSLSGKKCANIGIDGRDRRADGLGNRFTDG